MINHVSDLLLIKVNSKKKQYSNFSATLSAIEPPLWAVLMAAVVKEKGYSVRIIDAEALNMDVHETAGRAAEINPLLIGIIVSGSNLSASTQAMVGVKDFIEALRTKNAKQKIFLWGLHPSAVPEKTLREERCDFVVQGEGFTTVPRLIEKLKSEPRSGYLSIEGLWSLDDGKINSNPREPLVKNLDDLPMPLWELLPMDRYRAHNWHCFGDLEKRAGYAVVYTSLGCPYDCYFCSLKALFGKPGIRYRSPEKVVEEIDHLVKNYGIRNIKILDELFVLNKKHVHEICDLLIPGEYDLNIWAYARVDTLDKEMLKKMRLAGFTWLGLGVEAGNEKVRGVSKKRNFGQEKVFQAVDMIHAEGMHVGVNFIFGLPEDDQETMRETLEMAKELNCEYTNFYSAMAYPGSDLYRDAEKNHLKLPETWLGYAQFSTETFPLATKNLTASEVLKFRDYAFNEFHNRPEYLGMIRGKFGQSTVEHIRDMLKLRIERKYA